MARDPLLAASLVLMSLAGVASGAPANAGGGRTVLYTAIGNNLFKYGVNLESASLIRQSSVTLPANVHEAWVNPSRTFLYVAWSNGGSSYATAGGIAPVGDQHGISAYRIDSASGDLLLQGKPASLPSRPIYITTDIDGAHVLTAHNDPSGLIVHRIQPDGAIGEEVRQTAKLDFGIYGYQVRVDLSNRTVILVTRGNALTAAKPEDPGALRIFDYHAGLLSPRQTIAPGGAFGYQIRHLDFDPSGKWAYATLERQNKLHAYRRSATGALSDSPVFVKDTLADAGKSQAGQAASSIHVHPNGRFVYVANRAGGTVEFEGKRVFAGGENTIAVFSINSETGEPRLI